MTRAHRGPHFLGHREDWLVPLVCARQGKDSCALSFFVGHLVLLRIGIPVAQKWGRVCGWVSLASIALVFPVASFLCRRNSIRWVSASNTSHGAWRRRALRCTARLHCARRLLNGARRWPPT